MRVPITSCGLFLLWPVATSVLLAAAPKFEMHRVGRCRSEACGVGDFNNDGKLDIIAGPYLYLAPKWERVKIRTLEGTVDAQGRGYRYDFMNIPLDVDGDGLLDVMSCSWHEKRSVWFRNSGPGGGEWPETVIEVNGNFEHGDLWDIDNDGKKNEILPAVRSTAWYEVGKLPSGQRGIIKHTVSEKAHIWGVGAGDVNGDGRTDILRPGAWYEAPADARRGTWIEHALALGNLDEEKPEHTPQIEVYDVNDDGLGDIVTSSAHRYGIFWYQQIVADGERTWRQHVIDASWRQAHSLTLADLDADGDLDLVTGKRFKAHDGNDPGGNDPPGVYWYELKRGRVPVWTKHVISFGQGIGAGMNIPVVDLDADRDLDIVVTGKWGRARLVREQGEMITRRGFASALPRDRSTRELVQRPLCGRLGVSTARRKTQSPAEMEYEHKPVPAESAATVATAERASSIGALAAIMPLYRP